MGKGNHTRTGRADKLRRRASRAAKRQHEPGVHRHGGHGLVSIGPVPDGLDLAGWNYLGPGNDFDELDDLNFAGPDDALLDPSRCPVDDTCVGCGGRGGLAATTAAFTRPGGFDVACATVCGRCDGRSFLQLLDSNAMNAAFARHTEHAVADQAECS